ncbi:unnamed protein product [Camellia sinensis]
MKTGLESSENGLDFWDFYGDDLWDRVNGRLASYDEVPEQQTYRQGVSNEVLESGEETYFPALHVSLDNPSAM